MRKLVYLIPILFLTSCFFDFNSKRVHKRYYLVSTDNLPANLSYKLDNGDFIQRVPHSISAFQVVKDSLLIVQRMVNGKIEYYFINMKLDNGYSELDQIVTGPMDEMALKGYKYEYFNDVELELKSVK